ncbi:NAD-dependent epimerase/dehydratase family protein [Bradyrhizobium sp. PMVTL-01]|uniref:NAD-dependent epimerase/dehydratase family protein n=1 Tax=Bradyrhizobium sp. PMVTL-01 TaxID=3434999 RepID=UPI003F7176BC
MKVFLPGATGFIGGSVAAALLRRGDMVTSLVRSEEKASALRDIGINAVVGSLDDAELLARLSRESDAVINSSLSDHRGSVTAITGALSGSNKPFVHSSGITVICDLAWGASSEKVYDEYTPFEPTVGRVARVAIDQLVIDSANDGVRSSVIRPSVVYGNASGLGKVSGVFPPLIDISKRHRAGVYMGAGENVRSHVHIDDIVDLYLLALDGAPPGACYFAENGEHTGRNLATYVSHMLGFRGDVVSLTKDQAIEEFGELGWQATSYSYYGSNGRVRAVRARQELGWKPTRPPLLDAIEQDPFRAQR